MRLMMDEAGKNSQRRIGFMGLKNGDRFRRGIANHRNDDCDEQGDDDDIDN